MFQIWQREINREPRFGIESLLDLKSSRGGQKAARFAAAAGVGGDRGAEEAHKGPRARAPGGPGRSQGLGSGEKKNDRDT